MARKSFDFAVLSSQDNQYKMIPLENLVYNNDYERYEGERFDDMVTSIKKHGILQPLVVHSMGDEKYYILSGNNRRYCAEVAGYETVPCFVKENLSQEEQQTYIDETNVFQRGFSSLKISKQAEVIARRHSDMFDDEKFEAIQREIAAISGVKIKDNKLVKDDKEREKISRLSAAGQEYGLSQATVARLCCINKLTETLKPFIDNKTLAIRAGVALSYIDENYQKKVASLLADGFKIDMVKAEKIRSIFENGNLTDDIIVAIATGTYGSEDKKIKFIKLKSSFINKYFDDTVSEEDIQNTIEVALVQYFKDLERKEKKKSNVNDDALNVSEADDSAK